MIRTFCIVRVLGHLFINKIEKNLYTYIYIYKRPCYSCRRLPHPASHPLLFSHSPCCRCLRSISTCMFSLQVLLGFPLFLLLSGTQSSILLGHRSAGGQMTGYESRRGHGGRNRAPNKTLGNAHSPAGRTGKSYSHVHVVITGCMAYVVRCIANGRGWKASLRRLKTGVSRLRE